MAFSARCLLTVFLEIVATYRSENRERNTKLPATHSTCGVGYYWALHILPAGLRACCTAHFRRNRAPDSVLMSFLWKKAEERQYGLLWHWGGCSNGVLACSLIWCLCRAESCCAWMGYLRSLVPAAGRQSCLLLASQEARKYLSD